MWSMIHKQGDSLPKSLLVEQGHLTIIYETLSFRCRIKMALNHCLSVGISPMAEQRVSEVFLIRMPTLARSD